LSRAEQLKIDHGGAFLDDAARGLEITINNSLGFPERTISLENLRRIMSLRLEEMFDLVAQDIEEANLSDYLRGGAFLCGGAARIPRIAELAENALQMPVSLGKSNSISGLKSALDQPEFATAIGLVKFGSLKSRRRENGTSFIGTALKRLLKR